MYKVKYRAVIKYLVLAPIEIKKISLIQLWTSLYHCF